MSLDYGYVVIWVLPKVFIDTVKLEFAVILWLDVLRCFLIFEVGVVLKGSLVKEFDVSWV